MAKKQFALRLDPSLYDAIEKWAADEFRSVNSHIEFLLREATRKSGRLNKAQEPPKTGIDSD
ncbi:MAG: Arc family DNA-binding protein [Bacillota bacterium]|nr:Arc family DNA-binding protein [Bacillota bacterium]MDP4160049.1 Arc family DNA-binding protein [Bacillota bacterium]